ncbi:GNAT family N-acetyltransferase [Rhodobacterales bacterium HKCCE3408]|nr:GNAT family N-acetyltransferase [Rhodobacterales bacterium HKCCE3408]
MTVTLSNTPVLTTERLTMRVPEMADFEPFCAFVCSDRVRYIGGGADKDRLHAWRAFAHITGHWPLRGFGTFVLVDKSSGAPVGSAGPWFPECWPEHELGWTIWAPEAEGKSFAHEALIALRRHAYADLGWTTAVSYIDPENARSIALAERLGCRLEQTAPTPFGDGQTLVYRHPSPAEVAA